MAIQSKSLNTDGTLFAYGDKVRVERGAFHHHGEYEWNVYVLKPVAPGEETVDVQRWVKSKGGTEEECRAHAESLASSKGVK